MNTKARLFQIANFTNFLAIIIVVIVILYKTDPYHKSELTDGDIIGYSISLFVSVVYIVNFYFGLKIISAFYKETIDISLKSLTRVVFIVLEIIVLIAYTVLLIFLIPDIDIDEPLPLLDDIIRIVSLLCLFLGYPCSVIRLLLTRPLMRSITLKNKRLYEELGSQTQ